MSEIRNRLEAIGLGQYGDAFETNEIGTDLLGQVEHQMLKDMGVSIGGHRLRIRNAIAKFSHRASLTDNATFLSFARADQIADHHKRGCEPPAPAVASRPRVRAAVCSLILHIYHPREYSAVPCINCVARRI